jgi:hypothetical protein
MLQNVKRSRLYAANIGVSDSLNLGLFPDGQCDDKLGPFFKRRKAL